jgi:hypothetical protein
MCLEGSASVLAPNIHGRLTLRAARSSFPALAPKIDTSKACVAVDGIAVVTHDPSERESNGVQDLEAK